MSTSDEENSIMPPGTLPIAQCNQNCNCDAVYQPVCQDGTTYQNPCLAGCLAVNSTTGKCRNQNRQNYDSEFRFHTPVLDLFFDCSCVEDPTKAVTFGACSMDCYKSLVPYLALIFMITMITCCAQTPAIFITLRSVNEDERPIAMGMQYLLLRLLAYIPVSYSGWNFKLIFRRRYTLAVQLTLPVWFWTVQWMCVTTVVVLVPFTPPPS